MKIISTNKIAYHNYFVLSTTEAGIVLKGAEVKSIREGNVNLKDSFVLISSKNEVWVKNMHIANYSKDNNVKMDEKQDRKLLLNHNEIVKLGDAVKTKGLTIVPLKVYLNGQLVKLEIGLCKGKHTYDKKQVLKEHDIEREMQRDIKTVRSH